MLEAPSVAGSDAWFACLVRVAGYLASGGRFELVDQALARIDAAAASLEPAVLARAQDLRARVACFAGDHAVGVAGFEAAAAVFERLGDERSVAEMLTNRGVTLGELGALEQAEESLRRALGTAERLGLGYVSAGVRPNLVQILAFLGRAAEAQAVAERAVADTRAQGDRRFEGGALLYQAMALLLAGQAAAAETCAHAAVAALADVPPVRPAAVATLSRALLAQGRTAEALALAREANSLLDSLGQVEDGEVAIRLALAEALAANGDHEDAKAALVRARDRLAIRAAAIARPDWRESFLARIPDHARTTELARAWGLA
jgi:tetratricopeptide (TPR) repeat protein